MYVRRNLARGYSAKELNVSFLKEKKFRLQNKFDEIRDRSKRVIENIGEKRLDIIAKWEEKSRDFIDAFLLLFGREGTISNFWNESKEKLKNALSPPRSPTSLLNSSNITVSFFFQKKDSFSSILAVLLSQIDVNIFVSFIQCTSSTSSHVDDYQLPKNHCNNCYCDKIKDRQLKKAKMSPNTRQTCLSSDDDSDCDPSDDDIRKNDNKLINPISSNDHSYESCSEN